MTNDPFFGEQNQPQSGSDNSDPMLRQARGNETHIQPMAPEWGEGVITGDPPSHYVHLANGAVIEGCNVGTHYHHPTAGLIPVVAVFPKGA